MRLKNGKSDGCTLLQSAWTFKKIVLAIDLVAEYILHSGLRFIFSWGKQ
jgi:hypothetical protein